MMVDSRLPAKWRRKSGGLRATGVSEPVLGGIKQGPIKVEVEEEKLTWDAKSAKGEAFIKIYEII
jgi:hypothetical protein